MYILVCLLFIFAKPTQFASIRAVAWSPNSASLALVSSAAHLILFDRQMRSIHQPVKDLYTPSALLDEDVSQSVLFSWSPPYSHICLFLLPGACIFTIFTRQSVCCHCLQLGHTCDTRRHFASLDSSTATRTRRHRRCTRLCTVALSHYARCSTESQQHTDACFAKLCAAACRVADTTRPHRSHCVCSYTQHLCTAGSQKVQSNCNWFWQRVKTFI